MLERDMADLTPLQIAGQDMYLLGLLLYANRHGDGWQEFLDAFREHFNLHSCHLNRPVPNTVPTRQSYLYT